MQMRKLLYHRGIDDSIATYATDYIESFICAIYTAILIFKSRDKPRDKSTIAVIIQSAVSIFAMIGGLIHQYLYGLISTKCINQNFSAVE